MANYTANYNLKKPLTTENYDVADQNGNMDIIDTQLKANADAVSGLPKNKLDATVDPAVSNDTAEGYSPGSLWVNVTGKRAYVCTDATEGAAVWEIYTGLAAHQLDYAPHGVFNQTPELFYEDDNLVRVDTKDNTNTLRLRETLSYDINGNLETVNTKEYDTDGVTILKEFTDTLIYENGKVKSVPRMVA